MGIYGELMKLNQDKKAQKPKPEHAVVSPTSAVEREVEKGGAGLKRRDTKQPSNHATMTPRYRDTTIEAIRSAVKVFGKEAATHRFTLEEKRAIRDIVYAYEGQGVRTNENEISRIGVNFLVEDYRKNGENSVLHKVLKALNG